jgi:NAD(P)-dependent dehydrogenase (short-subunit alcohol dehydrogenase family)
MPNEKSLDGKSVCITGASRGIGKALSLTLARFGVRLALVARSGDELCRVAKECLSIGAQAAFPVLSDLSQSDACSSTFARALQSLGEIDILINNAGFNTRRARLEEVTIEEWDRLSSVNLRAPFVLCRDALRHMIPRRSGHIVNVLSVACFEHVEGMAVYSACKMGLMGLCRGLFYEAGAHNIRTSSIFPGATDSAKRFVDQIPYLTPETVAEQVLQVLRLPEGAVIPELVLRPMLEAARPSGTICP